MLRTTLKRDEMRSTSVFSKFKMKSLIPLLRYWVQSDRCIPRGRGAHVLDSKGYTHVGVEVHTRVDFVTLRRTCSETAAASNEYTF